MGIKTLNRSDLDGFVKGRSELYYHDMLSYVSRDSVTGVITDSDLGIAIVRATPEISIQVLCKSSHNDKAIDMLDILLSSYSGYHGSYFVARNDVADMLSKFKPIRVITHKVTMEIEVPKVCNSNEIPYVYAGSTEDTRLWMNYIISQQSHLSSDPIKRFSYAPLCDPESYVNYLIKNFTNYAFMNSVSGEVCYVSISKHRDYSHVISYGYTIAPNGVHMLADVLKGLALSELGSYDKMTVTVNGNTPEKALLIGRGFKAVELEDKRMLLCYMLN